MSQNLLKRIITSIFLLSLLIFINFGHKSIFIISILIIGLTICLEANNLFSKFLTNKHSKKSSPINKLNIKLPLSDGVLKLEVYDVLGKRVYKGLITQLESSVNVTNWKSGVYLVKVSNNEIVQTKRFIKQ